MSNNGRFAYSEVQIYCNDKGFFVTGESLKYFCAILNSAPITWLMKNNALTTGMGLLQWKKFAVEHLPIPRISAPEQNTFICLVDRILEAKLADPDADVAATEAEIDSRVHELYGLTEAEISAVEERTLSSSSG